MSLLTATVPGRDPLLVARAARSVWTQTLPAGWWGTWRIRLDGGTDDDVARLRALVESVRDTTSPWALTIDAHPERCGPNVTRNLMIADVADGEWVGFIDDDDEYLPGGVETLAVHAERPGIEWVAGRMHIVYPDGSEEHAEHRLPAGWVAPAVIAQTASERGVTPILTGAWLVRVDRLVEAGGFGALAVGGDVIAKTLVGCRHPGWLVDAEVYRYHRRVGSLSDHPSDAHPHVVARRWARRIAAAHLIT